MFSPYESFEGRRSLINICDLARSTPPKRNPYVTEEVSASESAVPERLVTCCKVSPFHAATMIVAGENEPRPDSE